MPASLTKINSMGRTLAAIAAGASVAAPLTVSSEGWENIGYPDPAHGMALATNCAGSIKNVVVGKYYSDDECLGRTASDLIGAGLAISKCVPVLSLPTKSLGAFIDMAYNVGAEKFCASSIAVSVRAGDLRTACARINQKPDGSPQWVFAIVAGLPVALPGLVKRRAAERALCEAGLAERVA